MRPRARRTSEDTCPAHVLPPSTPPGVRAPVIPAHAPTAAPPPRCRALPPQRTLPPPRPAIVAPARAPRHPCVRGPATGESGATACTSVAARTPATAPASLRAPLHPLASMIMKPCPRLRGQRLRDHGNVRVATHSGPMTYDIPAAAAEIAHWQAGAISRQQLLDAGLSTKLIERRLLRGRWQQLYRGVYAVFNGPPPRESWLWAAVLRAGPGAVLSHLTAAELHGLIDAPAEAIFVTVPSTGA